MIHNFRYQPLYKSHSLVFPGNVPFAKPLGKVYPVGRPSEKRTWNAAIKTEDGEVVVIKRNCATKFEAARALVDLANSLEELDQEASA